MSWSEEEIQKLTAVFGALGAVDAEAWARSQVEEGIPQLPIFLFLKSAIGHIRVLDDIPSLREAVRRCGSREASVALSSLVAKDENASHLLLVVQAVLCDYLSQLSFLLDDTAASRFSGWPFEALLEQIRWGLYQVDDRGKSSAPMTGLHEVVAELLSEELDSSN